MTVYLKMGKAEKKDDREMLKMSRENSKVNCLSAALFIELFVPPGSWNLIGSLACLSAQPWISSSPETFAYPLVEGKIMGGDLMDKQFRLKDLVKGKLNLSNSSESSCLCPSNC